ncbi:MAG: transcriptional repressor LexA [Pseudomonadota bacterium]
MLSDRQQDTYHFIRRYIARHSRAPLLSEIAEGLGIRSKGVVHRYVQALADEGLITLQPGRHRGITLTDEEAAQPTLPLLGRIAAGRPIEAIPGRDEVNLAEFFMGAGRFLLKVQGDSMIEAGILDGDMVVIERCDRADDGEVVVALIDGEEATLKRLENNRDGTVTLHPANSTLLPLCYAAERIAIQGRVIGQLRSYL